MQIDKERKAKELADRGGANKSDEGEDSVDSSEDEDENVVDTGIS